MTLLVPGTEQAAAVVSYWYCTDSPWGVGHALILWLMTGAGPGEPTHSGIFTDNLGLAQILVTRLTQHFPEFQEVPVETLQYVNAHCEHSYDGTHYRVVCQAPKTQIEIEWAEVLDRKQIIWPHFPTGENTHDLTTVICPCQVGRIQINGEAVQGEVQTQQNAEGIFSSTAFLAFAETWVGPSDKTDQPGKI
jgi:hypothetical protein